MRIPTAKTGLPTVPPLRRERLQRIIDIFHAVHHRDAEKARVQPLPADVDDQGGQRDRWRLL